MAVSFTFYDHQRHPGGYEISPMHVYLYRKGKARGKAEGRKEDERFNPLSIIAVDAAV